MSLNKKNIFFTTEENNYEKIRLSKLLTFEY